MNKLDLIKLAARTIVGVSTSFTVKQVIANNLDDPESTAQVCKMAVGTVVVGAMAANAAREYTDSVVDLFAEAIEKTQLQVSISKNKQAQS